MGHYIYPWDHHAFTMSCIEKKPIYDVYCIGRHQYQRYLNIFFGDVSVAHLVASMSGFESRKIFLSAQFIHYIPPCQVIILRKLSAYRFYLNKQ